MSFVTTRSTSFYLNNRQFLINGVNYFGAINIASSKQRLINDLKFLVSNNINSIRIMASSQGPDTEPFRITPSLEHSPYSFNPQLLFNLDLVLNECLKLNIKVILVLQNFWHWSGGFCQYLSDATATAIPYPTRDIKTWPEFEKYAKLFYTNTECNKRFKNLINQLITRTNSINGIKYVDDVSIFAWELCNEPRDVPIEWIKDTVEYIKTLDSNHLVCLGVEGLELNEEIFKDQHLHVDFTTGHCWVENWGHYNSDDGSRLNFDKAVEFAIDFTRKLIGFSKQLDKPFIMEEFGMARDGWKGSKYLMSTPTMNRDEYFEIIFKLLIECKREIGVGSGWMIWSFAGQGRVEDGGIIGDPPHEPRGWYSIYDDDKSTWKVVNECASQLLELGNIES